MDSDKQEARLTFGEKAVGMTFNPSGDRRVQDIKKAAANFIDTFHGMQEAPGTDGEVIAMFKLAQRAAQEAQMWAVKAAT